MNFVENKLKASRSHKRQHAKNPTAPRGMKDFSQDNWEIPGFPLGSDHTE